MERRPAHPGRGRESRQRRARALQDFERSLVERNLVPDASRLVTRRFGGALQVLAAIALGILLGTASILINLFLFTKLLHL
jgi:hypothetical protein